MLKGIIYDKVHNVNTGMVMAKEMVVGRAITCIDGEGRRVESIVESIHREKQTITITCEDGYQIIMPDRGIDKEFESNYKDK